MENLRQQIESESFQIQRETGSSLAGARLGLGSTPEYEQAVQDAPIKADAIHPTQDNETGLPFFTLDISALDGPDVLA